MNASIVAVDLGPTRTVVAGLSDRELGQALSRATDRSDADSLIDMIVASVDLVSSDQLAAVGVSVPRIVDFDSGCVVSTSRPAAPGANGALELPLADIPLREMLGDRLGVPVFIDNDANVSALAEAHDEELEPACGHLVMLTIGAGVGGGLVLGGRIYRGAGGAAGVLGHTILGLDLGGAVPRPMGFPQPGSLEFVASGHALDRLAALAGRVDPRSELARLRSAGKPVLSAAVVEAAVGGDKAARRMVEIWGQRIGIAVANLIHTFDPEEVVIAGEAAAAGALLLEPARRVALEYLLPGLGTRTRIRLGRHGPRARLLGAALMARYELDEPS